MKFTNDVHILRSGHFDKNANSKIASAFVQVAQPAEVARWSEKSFRRNRATSAGCATFLAAVLTVLLAMPGTALAQTTSFTYQGKLNDGGSPANGSYDLQFKLFDALSGGAQVGSTVTKSNVTVTGGIFSVTLNDSGQFGATAFPGAARWLEISVRLAGGGPFITLSPRSPITSTPYAVRSLSAASADTATTAMSAATADTANALSASCSACVTSSQINNINSTQINGTIAGSQISVPLSLSGNNGVPILTATNTGLNSGLKGVNNANTIFSIGVEGETSSTNGSGVYGTAFGSGGTSSGVTGVSQSSSGTGVRGMVTSGTGFNYGVSGESDSPDGIGVFGNATSASGLSIGTAGRSDSPSGSGVYGIAFSTTGTNFGVEGKSRSDAGRGVYGNAFSMTGTTYGVYGLSNSSSGTGVYGLALSAIGTNYGVYGHSNSQSGYAGYFSGRLLSTGETNLAGAWRTEKTAYAPNLIGGYMGTGGGGVNGNRVTNGVVGGTIGGGGFNGSIPFPSGLSYSGDRSNRVTDWFGSVGGGFDNRAGNDDATLDNAAFATVSGGYINRASGIAATIGGGGNNNAFGVEATIGGGNFNAAGGTSATIGGGNFNIADSQAATVGGGSNNTAGQTYATVGGGIGNTASAPNATVGGGRSNVASGERSVVPGGSSAVASHYGEMAFASSSLSNPGDAQTSFFTLQRITSNTAATTELFLDSNSTQRITLEVGDALAFEILVVAMSGFNYAAAYRLKGLIRRYHFETSFIGTPIKEVLGEESPTATAWDANVATDPLSNSLKVMVNGDAGSTIKWVASVRAAKVNSGSATRPASQ